MNSAIIAGVVFVSLVAAVFLGKSLRRLFPAEHLTADSRDTIKLGMGFVATMSALVLGLLVSSAKESFDTKRREVIQMAANLAFLDRALAVYGPETNGTRENLRATVAEAIHVIWPEQNAGVIGAPDYRTANKIYAEIEGLSPGDPMQTELKTQARNMALQLAQSRALLTAQSLPSISLPMLLILVFWLIVLFLGFSLLAPPNLITTLALLLSVLSASAAIFLLVELDQPFGGVIKISSDPLRNALSELDQTGAHPSTGRAR